MFLVGVWELRRWRPAPYPWPPAVGDQRRARLHIGAHDVSTQTLHPQWSGYGYTWRRDLNSVREQQFARGPVSQEWLSSPFNALIERACVETDLAELAYGGRGGTVMARRWPI